MSGISKLKNENGFALISILMFIMFLGLFGVTLATLIVADYKMQVVNLDRPRALYAAQSGIEYGLRGAMEYLRSNPSLSGLNAYSETVPAGSDVTATVTYTVSGTDSLTIKSSGFTSNFSQTITKVMTYEDISQYAVYATGNVDYITTIPAGLTRSGATNMPIFDLDELREVAKPTQYYPGNLTINSTVTFADEIIYTDRKLTFNQVDWTNFGTFVADEDAEIKFSASPLVYTQGNIYLSTAGSEFLSEEQNVAREIEGSLIVDGDVAGTDQPAQPYRFTIRYNRTLMNNFLEYSVNGGPLIINSSVWRTQH